MREQAYGCMTYDGATTQEWLAFVSVEAIKYPQYDSSSKLLQSRVESTASLGLVLCRL